VINRIIKLQFAKYDKKNSIILKHPTTSTRHKLSEADYLNPSAWGHLNPSSYCDVGRLFYGVFKLWSKLQRKKMKK